MQEVVVIAVKAAVMAATMTFRMSSQMLFFFMACWFTVYGLAVPPLPLKGATGVFRVMTECHCGPTKGSDFPVATESGGLYSNP